MKRKARLDSLTSTKGIQELNQSLDAMETVLKNARGIGRKHGYQLVITTLPSGEFIATFDQTEQSRKV